MRDPGPFDRMLDSSAAKDKSARTILIGMGVIGLILLILVLPPISLLSGDGSGFPGETPAGTNGTGGGGGGDGGDDDLASAPEGFEALSAVHRPDRPDADGPFAIAVPLARPATDGRNLGLYTMRDGEWVRIATAELAFDGTMARGEVAEIPNTVAVFRRVGSAMQVHGWLPAGAQIDPTAAELITTLNNVNFAPAADGSVTGTGAAPTEGATMLPTVRAVTPEEVSVVDSVLASPLLRDAHVQALVALATAPGNQGVDIDYRGLPSNRRPEYTEMVTALAQQLHSAGLTLTLTVPSPVLSAGQAWETGAYDWDAIGAQADYIKLVPEPGPDGYYERVEGALDYLRDHVDLGKVLLVVGRDSWEQSSEGLAPLSLFDALRLASNLEVRTSVITPDAQVVIVGVNIFQNDGATGIAWDEAARAVSFSYPGRGGQRTVWFENALSLAFRLDLARRYELGGIAIDNVASNPQAAAFWEPVRSFVETGEVALARPNGELLTPEWSAQAGELTPEATGSAIWKAPPQAAVYDVTLIVSDGVVRAKQTVLLDVREAAAGAAPTQTPVP